jgi:hypothetical protein
MAKVFICYARKDTKQVKSIVNEINGLGFDYWIDTRNIQSGEIWTKEISDAILACDKFLLFISQESMASDNVRREVQLAYENKKTLVLLRLEDAKIPSHLKYQLAGIQWIDVSASDWKSRLAIALDNKSEISLSEKPVKPAKKEKIVHPKSSNADMMVPGLIITSILEEKAKKRKVSNISIASPDIQVALFREALVSFNDFFDTGDLRRLSAHSFRFIVNDILRIIKGILELRRRSQLGYFRSSESVLEYLRNARDNLQIANGMFDISGRFGESKSAKFFAQIRLARKNIADALRYFK